jgi:hypothetical protein
MITRGPCRFWKASAPRSLSIVVFHFITSKEELGSETFVASLVVNMKVIVFILCLY